MWAPAVTLGLVSSQVGPARLRSALGRAPRTPAAPPADAPSALDATPAPPPAKLAEARVSEPSPAAGVPERFAPRVRRGPWQVLRRTVSSAWSDRILGLSAEAAFWQLLSLPPLLLGVLGSLGYFGAFLGPETLDSIEQRVLEVSSYAFTPQVIDGLIAPTLSDVLRQGRLEVVSVGFILSLWAGSSAMSTFVNTISIAYGQRDVRGAVSSRLLALRVYLVFVILSVISLPLLVLGPGLLREAFPGSVRDTVGVLIAAAYWPFLVVLLVVALASLYRQVLPRRPPWHRQLPGALLAVAIFVLGGFVVREYISYIVQQTFSYGALSTPIAALLFAYVIGLAVIFGAELNATIDVLWPSRLSRSERRRLAREALAAERSGIPLLLL